MFGFIIILEVVINDSWLETDQRQLGHKPALQGADATNVGNIIRQWLVESREMLSEKLHASSPSQAGQENSKQI